MKQNIHLGRGGDFVAKIDHYRFVDQIRANLRSQGLSLRDVIAMRELYFRVSLISNCNLSCTFCHNEGGPPTGRLSLENFVRATETAANLGFTRLQLTGGEPLLVRNVADFVRVGKKSMPDVGVTTNGVLLLESIDSLVEVGITRIHVSLQTETLIESGLNGAWGVPDWLAPILDLANKRVFKLRLNLPVPANMLAQADRFLHLMDDVRTDLKIFSVLPEGEHRNQEYPLDELQALTDRTNTRREDAGFDTRVLLRDFRLPTGFRCSICRDFSSCKEQSHSLRLGTDLVLRPCLASRIWDTQLDLSNLVVSIERAALMALDY